MRLVLYQPDIAQNVGTLFRLSACLAIAIDIIEPCGFPFDDRKFKRASMDYFNHVTYLRHKSYTHFTQWKEKNFPQSRLILLSTKASTTYIEFSFKPNDILMVGRESAGVPDDVYDQATDAVTIPMRPPMRSLNVAISASMVISEALRQTNGFTFTS